jgi:NAD(P)-dependent dehydrogenase (short-subunit alcohol dehydrogenase family)
VARRGIGRESALRFAAQGAKVAIADVNEHEGHEAVRQIEAAG